MRQSEELGKLKCLVAHWVGLIGRDIWRQTCNQGLPTGLQHASPKQKRANYPGSRRFCKFGAILKLLVIGKPFLKLMWRRCGFPYEPGLKRAMPIAARIPSDPFNRPLDLTAPPSGDYRDWQDKAFGVFSIHPWQEPQVSARKLRHDRLILAPKPPCPPSAGARSRQSVQKICRSSAPNVAVCSA